MLIHKQNQEVTQTDPGTPCGEFMRRYWQPVALVDELPDERPLTPVRILGEDLVLFRDEEGVYGLIDRFCAHRGADLAYGRLEDGGLRCTFHGWCFDARGKCLEQPPEPIGSKYFQKVEQTAYPCQERSGIIFAYMGPGRPPAFPEFDCFIAPDEYTFAFKGFMECNWLQALEVGIDPAHASFLHRVFEDEDTADHYGKQFRDEAADSGIPITRLMREFYRPEIVVEETEFGMRLITLRQINDEDIHVRVTNAIFPHGIVIPMSKEMTITQWHVPVDDTHSYWYAIFTSFGAPVNKEKMRQQRLQLYELPGYKPRIGKANNYGYSMDEQKRVSFTGMGDDINVHDQWAVESQGPIHDRTLEHLARSDIGIITYRKMLRQAIAQVDQGIPPLMVVDKEGAKSLRGPEAVDAFGKVGSWENSWRDWDEKRRSAAAWVECKDEMDYRAVRCILVNEDRFLLAVHNNRIPENIGKWGLPGGHIEEGELFETTATREMHEEFDLRLTQWKEISDYEYNGSIQKVLATQFHGNGNLEYDRNEILEIAWYTIEELQKMHEAGKMHTGFELDAVSKYLELHVSQHLE